MLHHVGLAKTIAAAAVASLVGGDPAQDPKPKVNVEVVRQVEGVPIGRDATGNVELLEIVTDDDDKNAGKNEKDGGKKSAVRRRVLVNNLGQTNKAAQDIILHAAPGGAANLDGVHQLFIAPDGQDANLGGLGQLLVAPDGQNANVFVANVLGQGTLGISVRNVDDILRHHLDLPKDQGLVIIAIDDKGLAAKSGLKPNDIVVAVAGEGVSDLNGLTKAVDDADGKPIKIKILRGGKSDEIDAKFDAPEGEKRYQIGVMIAEIDDVLRSQLDIKSGVAVADVVDDSPAEAAGVEKNDIVVLVDDTEVKGQGDISAAVQKSEGKEIVLKIVRDGDSKEIKVTPKLSKIGRTMNARVQGFPQQGNLRFFGPGVVVDPKNPGQQHFELRTMPPAPGGAVAGFPFPGGNPGELEALRKELAELREQLGALRKELNKDGGK